MVYQALCSTIPSDPASVLVLGPQTSGYGMALCFFRVHPQIMKGLVGRGGRETKQNSEQESVEDGGRILAAGAEQGLQD